MQPHIPHKPFHWQTRGNSVRILMLLYQTHINQIGLKSSHRVLPSVFHLCSNKIQKMKSSKQSAAVDYSTCPPPFNLLVCKQIKRHHLVDCFLVQSQIMILTYLFLIQILNQVIVIMMWILICVMKVEEQCSVTKRPLLYQLLWKVINGFLTDLFLNCMILTVNKGIKNNNLTDDYSTVISIFFLALLPETFVTIIYNVTFTEGELQLNFHFHIIFHESMGLP